MKTWRAQSKRGAGAFTLVEVILAILIISGIMSVLLYFYQRAAQTREMAMKETEFITVSRLFLEQLTTELRSARFLDQHWLGLEGNSNRISFIYSTLAVSSIWITPTNEPVLLPPNSDLRRLEYRLLGGVSGPQVVGISRMERMIGASIAVTNNIEMELSDSEASEAEETNGVTIAALTVTPVEPLTDKIRFLQFRYWDGTEWLDIWSGPDLPGGVEVTVGREPASLDREPASYGGEVFRRVIYLPQSEHPGNRILLEELGEEMY